MGTCGPQLIRKAQIGGRVQDVEGTIETLGAFDFKTRLIVGAAVEYNAPREKRDIARATLTNLGGIEGTKANNHTFSAEVNTPDAFNVAATAGMDVESILWQSGNTIRYTFNGSPDLSGVQEGSYLTSNYATNSSNDGTFLIVTVNDGSDYVDVINYDRSDNTDDEASLSPAVGDVQNNLEYQWALNGCGAKVYGMSRIAVGAISSGPYSHGETITGGTSTATGRVVVPAANGDSYIYFEPLTGTFSSGEVITGGTSSATSTSGGTPEVHGYYVQPISTCQNVITVEYQEDGYAWSARDAMGNLTGTFEANKQGIFEFAFQGPRGTNGDKALTSSVTRGTEDPPIMKDANLTLGGSFEPVFSSVSFDMGNTLAMRANGNAADDTGYEGTRITGRDPKITITLEHELASVFDFFGTLDAGTKTALEFRVGTSENKQFWYFADELEFEALPLGEADGIRTLELSALCTGDATSAGEDEWEMAFIGN